MKTASKMDRSRAKSVQTTSSSAEISKIGITIIGFTAAIIGCWAVVNIISGTISSGGPLNLVSSLLKAING